jgi:hypothetical protein
MGDAESAALAISESIKQLFQPFQELLQQLLGPAATEVGGSFGDSLKVWRLKRQVQLLGKVKSMTEGKDINSVAPRLFFPILEAASIEADDVMQERWAALLANEAVNTDSVHPSFVEILKQMSPSDARLLDKLYDWGKENGTVKLQWWLHKPKLDDQELTTLQRLFRLGFVEATYDLEPGEQHIRIMAGEPQVLRSDPKLNEHYTLTVFGLQFVEGCRAPKAKSEAIKQSA